MSLFLGHLLDIKTRKKRGDFYLPVEDLLTHIFICGVTGSGKTVLGKAIIEEAALHKIPAIVVDLKGDLSSLGLAFSTLEAKEFAPWIDPRRDMRRLDEATRIAALHAANLRRFGLTSREIARFKENTRITIFTPVSNKGIPLALSSLPSPPADVKELYEREPETVISMIDSLTASLVERLFPGEKPSKVENERKYLYALVEYAWLNGIALEGLQGLAHLVELIQNPPFDRIGVLPLDEYISTQRRTQLAAKVNGLLIGAEQLWYQGYPLDIDGLTGRFIEDERTQISIINLTEINSIQDRNFVVSHLAYAIHNWMRRLGSSLEPRLIFYIDEIGGGGGKYALYPSPPYNSASKPALDLLLRQGRAFGVSCILATQNPGDIDYRGLSNCGIWAIGKLSTKRDREKVIEGISTANIAFQHVHELLTTPEVGEFLIKTRSGQIQLIRERWLLTYHKTIAISELARLTDQQIRLRFTEKAQSSRSTTTPVHVPKTPQQVYATFNFGRPVSEPYITVIDPLGALSLFLEKLAPLGIKLEDLHFNDVKLEIVRICSVKWSIEKIRRDSQGRVREHISKKGVSRYHSALTPSLSKTRIKQLYNAAEKGSTARWAEYAARVDVLLPPKLHLTKRQIRQEVAPRYNVPQRDVYVEIPPVLNVGHQYRFQTEYRSRPLEGFVDAVTGKVELKLPSFSLSEALEEVRRCHPEITQLGEVVQKEEVFIITGRSEDYNYVIEVNKHSCKITSITSTVTEARARKLAYRVEPSEPFYIGRHNGHWVLVYPSGQIVRINERTEGITTKQILPLVEAENKATEIAKGLNPDVRLVDTSFSPDDWRFRFQYINQRIIITVHPDGSTYTVVQPDLEWLNAKLKDRFPEAKFGELIRKERAEVNVSFISYSVEVDDPRLTCTIVFHPDGRTELISKLVKREFAEAQAVLTLKEYGISSPQLLKADYMAEEAKWHFDFMAAEGKFQVIVDENQSQVMDLTISKFEAENMAMDWLRGVEVEQAELVKAVFDEGVWSLELEAPEGWFKLHISAEECRLAEKRLTEEGIKVFVEQEIEGEVISIRKPLLSFGRYWEVGVKTEEGIRKLKVNRKGEIIT